MMIWTLSVIGASPLRVASKWLVTDVKAAPCCWFPVRLTRALTDGSGAISRAIRPSRQLTGDINVANASVIRRLLPANSKSPRLANSSQ